MYVACDESSTDKPIWVIGSLWVPDRELIPHFEEDVARFRLERKCWGEFKWARVSDQHADVYQDFLAQALSLEGLFFCCIVIDTAFFTTQAMRAFHGRGRKKEMFMKSYRQLLSYHLRRLRQADGGYRFYIVYDPQDQVDGEYIAEFRRIIRYDAGAVIDYLGPGSSGVSSLIQAADLITGAVATAWNKDIGVGPTGETRQRLTDQIEQWTGLSLNKRTNPAGNGRFALWHWDPTYGRSVVAVQKAKQPTVVDAPF